MVLTGEPGLSNTTAAIPSSPKLYVKVEKTMFTLAQ